jgi:GTPase SAR1 family protein
MVNYFEKILAIKNSHQQSSIEEDVIQCVKSIEIMVAELKVLNESKENMVTHLIKTIENKVGSYDANEQSIRVYIVGDRDLGKSSLVEYLSENESSLTYVDTDPFSKEQLSSLMLADCVLYMINPETIYFQKADYLVDYLKSKPVIGVLNKIDVLRKHSSDSGVDEFLADSRKYYKEMFTDVVAVSVETHEALDDLIELIQTKFISKSNDIRIKSLYNASKGFVREFHQTIKTDVQELRIQDNNRIVFKSEYKKLYDSAMQDNRLKIDMFLKSYDLDVNNNMNMHLQKVLTQGQQKHFIENELFMLSGLENQLQRLIKSLNTNMSKFVEEVTNKYLFGEQSHLHDIEMTLNMENIEYLNMVELNIALNALNEGGLFVAFTKKKKLQALEVALKGMKEDLIKRLEAHFDRLLKSKMAPLYDYVFKSIDDTFEEKYCEIEHVGTIIRLLEKTIKDMDIGEIDVSLKNIILGKIK